MPGPERGHAQELDTCGPWQPIFWLLWLYIPKQLYMLATTLCFSSSQSSLFVNSIFVNLPTPKNLLVTPKSTLGHFGGRYGHAHIQSGEKFELSHVLISQLESHKVTLPSCPSSHSVNKHPFHGLSSATFSC